MRAPANPRLDAFYAAREDAAARQAAAPVFRWAPDGSAVAWRSGGREGTVRLGPGADPAEAGGAVDAPRLYMRETYLVPEWPTLEAVSPDGGRFASVQEGEVCVRWAGQDAAVPLTTGATDDVGWDLDASAVSPWSPDGAWLFADRVDRTRVGREVRTRFAPQGTVSVDRPRIQRAGGPLDGLQPHVLPTGGGAPRPLLPDWTEDAYVRLVGWLPGSDGVVFARFSRLLDAVELWLWEVAGGAAQVVLSERSATFLRPSTLIWTAPVGCWLRAERRFLWLSERDGWAHLHLGSLDREGLVPLASGPTVVHEVVAQDDAHVWFTASRDGPRPYDRHLFRVGLDGGEPVQVSEGDGEHTAVVSPDGRHLVDTWSSPAAPRRAVLRTMDGAPVATLDLGDPPPRGQPAPEEVRFLAADGETALHGVLYRPAEGPAGGRAPLVHWVYGGPQMTVTPRRFEPSTANEVLFQALAAVGYAVLVLDARGTPGRSKAFQNVAWRSFAPHVVADQTGALRQLLARDDGIDPGRIGGMGRSWGAHFALRMLAAAPDLYRAAALVVPGLDPYGGVIYEPYLGLPQAEPDAYRAAEPWDLPAALRPDARLLLMAGTLDSPCQWDMQRLSRLLVEANIAHHTLAFAEQEHVFAGAVARFHDRAVFEFFEAALA